MEQKKGIYIYKKELEHCYHRCRFFFILRQLELSIDICLSLVSGVPLFIRIRCHHASDHAEFGRDLGPGQSCFRIQVTFKIYLKFMTNVNGTTGLFIIVSVSANRLFLQLTGIRIRQACCQQLAAHDGPGSEWIAATGKRWALEVNILQ